MNEFWGALSANVIDVAIYGAILVSFFLGLGKCVVPLRRAAHLFRKAVHNLALFKPADTARPDWQDSLFLGKPMQRQWKRFLMNAEQLDARGLSLGVEDYINDEEVLSGFAHFQLAEVIPGVLTSLGILGTFIGLMRGLSNLNLSSADHTVTSIHTMISGMTFAYGTSILGLVCSLFFNILFRSAQGAATGAMDDFTNAFSDVVMLRPLDDSVRQTCYMEDQATFLSGAFSDVNQRLESGIGAAVERSFTPIGQAMQSFILSQAQTQVEGLSHVVNQFVERMNAALGGQFQKLGQTLAQMNTAQAEGAQTLGGAMGAANEIMQGVLRVSGVTQEVVDRFDSYVGTLTAAQQAGAGLMEKTARALSAIERDAALSSERFQALRDAQADLARQMEQYAGWSGRVLEAVEKQADAAGERAHEIASEMGRSGKLLQEGYTDFAQSVSAGLSRTMGLFEENLHEMTAKMVADVKEALAKNSDGTLDLRQFTRVQQALNDMTAAITRATRAAEQLAEGA